VVGAVAFSRDGRRLASSDQSHGEVRLWDLEEGALVRSFVAPAGEVGALALSGDGALVARGSERHGLEVFEAQTGRQVFATETGRGGARGLAFAPGGLLLASFSRSPPAVFEAATGKVVRQLPDELAPASAALSADGRTLACAAQEALLLFGFPDLAPAGRLEPRVGPLELVAAPDGARVAATRPDRTVASLEVADPAHPQILRGHLEAITALAFTGDGRRLVSQSFDGVRVWDVASGQLLMLLRGRNAEQSVAASSDGARLAVGGVDERVRVLRFAREPQIRSFAAHSDATRSVAFSADGRRVATGGGGKDASARVWDAATLAPTGHARRGAGASWLTPSPPDCRRLALLCLAGELASGTGSGSPALQEPHVSASSTRRTRPTARSWPNRRVGPSASSTRSGGPVVARWWATRAPSGAWRSRPTGSSWPPRAPTTPCACGTSRPGGRSGCCAATATGPGRWTSRPTAARWRPAARTGRSSCGSSPATGRRPGGCAATRSG
jgi:hypothetical protein